MAFEQILGKCDHLTGGRCEEYPTLGQLCERCNQLTGGRCAEHSTIHYTHGYGYTAPMLSDDRIVQLLTDILAELRDIRDKLSV